MSMIKYRILERPASEINSLQPGLQTGGTTLGISRVEKDPSQRNFFYWIAIEKPAGMEVPDLEHYRVPAARSAVFECWGDKP